MATSYTHPKDCTDHKDAATDRKARAIVVARRQEQLQVWAHTQWLDWFPPNPYTTQRRGR
jgi:hypothetical protein